MKLLSIILLAASCYGQCGPDQTCVQANSPSGWSGGVLWSASPTSPQVRYASNFSYSRPIENGLYVVTFYFVEPNATAKGQRLFDVRVNQQLVFSKLDLFDIAGVGKLLKRAVVVAVVDGTIAINFDTASTRPAVVSAIRIAPLGITLSE